MTRSRILLFLAFGMAALTGGRSASADLILSTNVTSYTTTVGGTVDVSVLLSQNATGAQIDATNGLAIFGIVTNFASPSGIASVQSTGNILIGSLFDSATASKDLLATSASVSAFANDFVNGITSVSPPLLLATFRFTGLSVGTTTITVGAITPGSSFGGTNLNVTFANPASVTATIQVTAVPEPSSWAMGLIGGIVVGGGLLLRRRFVPAIA